MAPESSSLPSLARVIYNGTTAAGLVHSNPLIASWHALPCYILPTFTGCHWFAGRETDPPAPEGGKDLPEKKLTEMEIFTSALYNVLGVGHKNTQTRVEAIRAAQAGALKFATGWKEPKGIYGQISMFRDGGQDGEDAERERKARRA